MNPEQQAEYRRREHRKNFTSSMAVNASMQLLQVTPEKTNAEIVERAWAIGVMMADQMAAHDCEPS